jgi:hypothetical protein
MRQMASAGSFALGLSCWVASALAQQNDLPAQRAALKEIRETADPLATFLEAVFALWAKLRNSQSRKPSPCPNIMGSSQQRHN